MPQTLDHKPIRVAQSGARPLRAYRPEPLPPNPNHPPAPWILLLGAVCLAAALSACALWYRRGAHRACKAFSASVGGEF